MPSYQNSAPGAKAAKFINQNPLDPLTNPFSNIDDSQKEYQEALSENVNKRLEKAMGEIVLKHQKADDAAAQAAIARNRIISNVKKEPTNKPKIETEVDESDESDSDDDKYLDGLDDDPALNAIRQRRLNEIKREAEQKAINLSKGHGQYRTIYQDNFLTECCSSDYVAVHFYHNDFERCKIMDHHLGVIAPLYINCKFIRIDAEKSPFFVDKLKIKTLPALIVFKDGKTIDRLTGFDGLVINKKDPDKWHTGRLVQWLSNTGAVEYFETEEELENLNVSLDDDDDYCYHKDNIYDDFE